MASAWCTVSLLIVISLHSIQSLNIPKKVNRPPSIISQSDPMVYIIAKVPIVLTCVADAHPDVKSPEGYKWTKDGQPLNVTSETENPPIQSIVMSAKVGTITFRGNEKLNEDELKKHEGVYQCFATNQRGTAMSNNITVKVAEIPFQPPENQNIRLKEGDSLSLPCDYNTSNGQEITWKSKYSDNLVSQRISQQPNGNLVFSNVVAGLDDGLEFWCVVKDLATRKSTDGLHYILAVDTGNPVVRKPVEIVAPQLQNENITVLRGQEELKLTCVTTGKPTPTVRWEVVGGSWPERRISVKYSGHTVVISNVALEDERIYKCIANNSLEDEVTKTISVSVHAKPYFPILANRLHNITKEPGGNATLRCKPKGIPPPTVEWRVNGIRIEDAPPMANREVHANKIKFKDLLKNESAVYQCISHNKYGSDIQQAFINVLTWEPVVLDGHQLRYRQVEGANVEMKCHVFGSPPPSITWLRDGHDITNKNRFSNQQKHKYLKIQNLERDDSGTYKCYASNPHGNDFIDMTLEVLNKTRITSIGGGEVKLGQTRTLSVQVTTDREIPDDDKVTWSKGNIQLGKGNSYFIQNADFNDAGIYTASVTTEVDRAEVNITLTVIDKPLPPQSFTFVESSDDPLKATFTWKPGFDNFAPITGYRIEFEEDIYQPGRWQILKDSIDGSTDNVQVSLSPGVNYQFRAWARNSVGISQKPTGATRRYKTPDGLPSNPTGIKCEGTLPGKILVTWHRVPYLNRNAPGFGYLLSFRPANSSEDWTTRNVTGDQIKLEIIGSGPYEPYVVKLQSYNNEGKAESVTGPIETFTGEGVPEVSPSGLGITPFDEDPTRINISWNPVDKTRVRGVVLGYNITYRKETEKEMSKKVVGDVTSATVEDLSPQTKYVFTVSVFNKAGFGKPSEPIPVTTLSGAPGKGEINVTAGAREANVTWYPAGGLPAEKILVQYKKNKAGERWKDAQTYQAKPEPMSVSVARLEPSTFYSFRVISINQHGNSTSPLYSIQTTRAGVAAASVTSEVWFIVIMCLIGLLILLILIICFVRRGRGGKYSVAEKEHHLVESQPLENNDSGEYNDDADEVKKPLTDSIGASSNGGTKSHPDGAPLGAMLRTRGDSVGGDSIEAFVGADPKEFNEDGSFIGQYGVTESENTTPATPPSGNEKSPKHPEGDAV